MIETPSISTSTRELRAARFEDIDGVLVPIDQLCRPHSWSHGLFARELENKTAAVQVLMVAGQPAGFIVTWWVCDEVEIQNICVHPDYRRNGHALWMIDEVVRAAQRREMRALRLEVRVSNAGALSLYHGRGFLELARRSGYYADNGEDAILLGFALEPPPSGC